MSERPTLVFDTTTAALWAEEVAGDRRIPVEVVPAPAASKAPCDLALVTLPDRAEALTDALDQEGVSYRVWTGSAVALQDRDGGVKR